MPSGHAKRILVTLAVAIAFGIAASVLKGNGSGLRDAAGNVSAPWLILPLLAGAFAAPRQSVKGALVGLAATLAALVAFYFANAFVLDLGQHSTLQSIGLTMSSVGNVWFQGGLVVGVLFGAAGATLAGRGRWRVLVSIVAVLLIFEPMAWLCWAVARGDAVRDLAVSPFLWAVEIGAGLVLFVATRRQSLNFFGG